MRTETEKDMLDHLNRRKAIAFKQHQDIIGRIENCPPYSRARSELAQSNIKRLAKLEAEMEICTELLSICRKREWHG